MTKHCQLSKHTVRQLEYYQGQFCFQLLVKFCSVCSLLHTSWAIFIVSLLSSLFRYSTHDVVCTMKGEGVADVYFLLDLKLVCSLLCFENC